MTITALPDAPLPGDDRATFNAKSFAFVAALENMVDEFNSAATAYALSLSATSTTELTIGLGAQSLTVQTGKGYLPGQEVVIASTATGTDRMGGTVTSYDIGTGALEVTVTATGGSGTLSAWTISPTTIAGLDGQTFTNLVLAGQITETPYELTGTDIDPANGTLQYKAQDDDETYTISLAVGQSVAFELDKGAHSAVWPTMDWVYGDPTLSSTDKSLLVFFNITGTVCGIYCGPQQ